ISSAHGRTRSGKRCARGLSSSPARSRGRRTASISPSAAKPSSSKACGRTVTMISYGLWQRRFGGAADVIGKTIIVERVPYTIVGVTPPEFTGPEVGRGADVILPIGTEPLVHGADNSSLDQRQWWWLNVMARLKPGQSVEGAAAAVRAVQPQLREETGPRNQRPENAARYLAQP